MLALPAISGCKRERTLRDIGTLPHVERARGKIQPEKVAWAYDYQLDKARVCYDEALAKDRNQRGTVIVTAHRPSDFGNVDVTAKRSGTISSELEKCIAWEFRAPPNVAPRSKETATLVLEPEIRREPAPPGDFAFRKVVERMLEPATLRVIALEVRRQPEVLTNGDRFLFADCTAKVEFSRDGEDDFCGDLRPPAGPSCRGKSDEGGCVCAKAKRKKGEQLELKGQLSFRLTQNGWIFSRGMYDDDRHFFGDVAREE